ncbi:MFS transporter [Rhodococcus ruber Chol-4]|uniref:Major facilitator superfamily multidrug resistance protein n=1 Tax=Rhodococcus ruber TaxID=1830 RepID=A0A098BNU1_9NOCA|nr:MULTISPECIES: MFS transporter [Rhodococcus]MDO2380767.1 MFS transporter [Rhodococcus ruber]RIK12053.1 MAG: MFS transporter [Acidobacteriota bacterium]AWG97430.1 MFS transporter [Rhodococcus ruber]AXY50108.1 MFS transporter permease [Rhodococcus ruber]KXF84974.1 MFS transporter [Rhodococcus ruber Chol-4]
MAYVSTHPLRLRGSRPDRSLAGPPARGAATAVAPRPSRFVFPILAVGAIFQAIMQTVMVPLLPSMPALTGAGTTAVSWLVTATLLVGAVMTPIFGRLADMVGKKRMLLVALVLMTVGSLLCAISSNIAVLITARGLQGAGAAVIPIGMSILREELPRDRVGRAVALLSSTLGLGTALGIPFAAAIVQFADWHVLFWVTTAIGAAVATAAAVFIRESRTRTGGRFDGVGAVGLSAALVSLLVPLTQGSTWGWTSPAVLSMFAAAVVLFGLWGFQQLRNRNPLVDLRASARRTVLMPHLAALLVGFAFYGNTLITTQLLQADPDHGAGYGLPILLAALCQLPASFAMMSFALVAARLSDRWGTKVPMLAGALFLLGGYSLHAVPDKPLWSVVVALGVAAIGTTLVYCTLPVLIMGAVPLEQTAAANGVNVLLRTTGSTVCSAVVATVLAAHLVNGGIAAAGFSIAYLACAACAVVVFVAALALPAANRRPVEHVTSEVPSV